MKAEEIRFESNGVTLAGALTLPPEVEQPVIVLMLHGSGSMDRDQNMKGQKL